MKSLLNDLKKSKSKFLVIFIIVFIGGYTFFFTAGLWMNDPGSASAVTPLNKVVKYQNREISIIKWVYSKDQSLMEVMLDVTNTAFDGIDTYEYSAIDSNKNHLSVEPIIEAADFVVLHISDVPDDFKEISLRMRLPEDASDSESVLKLYTNLNDVEAADAISARSEAEYRVLRVDTMINHYEDEISALEANISDFEEDKKNAKDTIKEFETNYEYLTEEEKSRTDELIRNGELKISETDEKIKKANEEIEELKEKIKNAHMLKTKYEDVEKDNSETKSDDNK